MEVVQQQMIENQELQNQSALDNVRHIGRNVALVSALAVAGVFGASQLPQTTANAYAASIVAGPGMAPAQQVADQNKLRQSFLPTPSGNIMISIVAQPCADEGGAEANGCAFTQENKIELAAKNDPAKDADITLFHELGHIAYTRLNNGNDGAGPVMYNFLKNAGFAKNNQQAIQIAERDAQSDNNYSNETFAATYASCAWNGLRAKGEVDTEKAIYKKAATYNRACRYLLKVTSHRPDFEAGMATPPKTAIPYDVPDTACGIRKASLRYCH